MPYIGWQRKRLGQGGDRRLGLLKLQLRMRRGFVIFPGAGSCLRGRLHIFLGGKNVCACVGNVCACTGNVCAHTGMV